MARRRAMTEEEKRRKELIKELSKQRYASRWTRLE